MKIRETPGRTVPLYHLPCPTSQLAKKSYRTVRDISALRNPNHPTIMACDTARQFRKARPLEVRQTGRRFPNGRQRTATIKNNRKAQPSIRGRRHRTRFVLGVLLRLLRPLYRNIHHSQRAAASCHRSSVSGSLTLAAAMLLSTLTSCMSNLNFRYSFTAMILSLDDQQIHKALNCTS